METEILKNPKISVILVFLTKSTIFLAKIDFFFFSFTKIKT